MKQSLTFAIILIISFWSISAPIFSFDSGQSEVSQQDSVPKLNSTNQHVYITTRLVTGKPLINGKLDDECWKTTGVWAGDYHQFIPTEGAKPTYPTEMKILYDDKNVYVAFRAFDGEPEKIQRRSGVRDARVGDFMGVNFDSFNNHRTSFEFTITAWGQKFDVVCFNPDKFDINWNAVWKGKTGLEDSAWVAELEIPLSQLRYSNENEQVWGLHAYRWLDRIQEESEWEPLSNTGPGYLYQMGELRGIKGLKKSQRLEIMPYMRGDLKTMKVEPGNPFTNKGRVWGGNMGFDAKIGISSNFTVDLTVNPDFGQVESDPSVLNLTAFETFYEEKRPFFLEGLTIFDYKFDNQSLFYSRRIGHSPSLNVDPTDNLFVKSPDKTSIMSAIKFSGSTSKGLSVGLIQSVTANEFVRLSDENGNRSSAKVEPLTNYMVARIQKGYNADNTVVGSMLTSTNRFIEDNNLEFLSSDAFTGGLDLLHYWKDKEFFVDARLIGSYINGSREAITALQESSARYYQKPGADYLNYDTTRTRLSGYGGKFKIGKGSKGLWRYSTGATWLSPGLELNDLGYMNSVDEINQENEISNLIIKPVSIFRTYNISLKEFNTWNFNGTYLGSGLDFSFSSAFKNKWGFATNLIYHSKTLDTKILRSGYDMMMPQNFTSSVTLSTDQSKRVTASLSYGYVNTLNNSATSNRLKPGLTIRPFGALKIGMSANYIDNHDKLQYVATRNMLSEKRYILGTIEQKTFGLTFRVDLNLTPEFSVQYYGSPFISRGSYSEFKRVTDPLAKSYEDRFAVFNDPQLVGDSYELDENNDMIADYSIENPDFNFHEFRSNFVAKWEYRLGSFIYLVWSSERTERTSSSKTSIGDSYRQLIKVFPNNIFLIKLNYWFSV